MESKFAAFMEAPIIAASTEKHVWDSVLAAKIEFIENGIVPEPSTYLPQEIIDSWIRSKAYNVNWQQKWPPHTLPQNEVNALLAANKLLIGAAAPFLKSYNEILHNSEFNMVLYDANGTILGYALKKNDENIAPGGVRHEKFTGCMAHTMAAHYKRPVQIIGPVNYSKALEKNITSASPILNEYGELLGCIVLYQMTATGIWQMGHSLGWVTSTAMAISSQLRLHRRDTRLKVMDETLKAALGNIRDAFISVDASGHIINTNKEAGKLSRICDSKPYPLIYDLLKDSSAIRKALQTGTKTINNSIIFKHEPRKIHTCTIEPFSSNSRVDGAIIKIIKNETIKDAVTFENITHKSRVMNDLIDTAALIGRKPVNILLLGESGTGKELFAQAIHNSRGEGPFIAINCASMPANLIESELFGYEKGAFTGADKEGRKGKIEHADGGTLFLDEIGDMPLELQPVLLRVLEERKIVRIGGHKNIPVNFRVIAATNRPLFEDVKNKLFRSDLYFRLSVVSLEIPPLRERGMDTLLLAEKFINEICESFELPKYTLSDDAKDALLKYDWPGNIRQLSNAITYAVSFAKSNIITPNLLPREITSAPKPPVIKDLKNIEKDILRKTVAESGSMEEAAKKLGISRSTLYRKLYG